MRLAMVRWSSVEVSLAFHSRRQVRLTRVVRKMGLRVTLLESRVLPIIGAVLVGRRHP